jgi:hypothetical protein
MADAQTVWRVIVSLEGGGAIYHCDTIEHEGEKWLVPEWRHSKTEEWSMPARVVRLSAFRHQWHPGSKMGDGTVNDPIPKHLMEMQSPLTAADASVATDEPDIKRIVPRRSN